MAGNSMRPAVGFEYRAPLSPHRAAAGAVHENGYALALRVRDAVRALASEAVDVAALRLLETVRDDTDGVSAALRVVHAGGDDAFAVPLRDVAARLRVHASAVGVAAVRLGAEKKASGAALVRAAISQLIPDTPVHYWDAEETKAALLAAGVRRAIVVLEDSAMGLPPGDWLRVLRFMEAVFAERILLVVPEAAMHAVHVPLHLQPRISFGALGGVRSAADVAADVVLALLSHGLVPSADVLRALIGPYGTGLRSGPCLERVAVLCVLEQCAYGGFAPACTEPCRRLWASLAIVTALLDVAGARAHKAAAVLGLHALDMHVLPSPEAGGAPSLGDAVRSSGADRLRALAALRLRADEVSALTKVYPDPRPAEWTTLGDALNAVRSLSAGVCVPASEQLRLGRSAAKQLFPRVHETLELALVDPSFYGSVDTLSVPLGDVCAAHAVLRECAQHVNARDWLLAFSARVCGAQDPFANDAGDASRGEDDAEARAVRRIVLRRFVHAVLQMQMLGYVVPSGRRREHFERVFFFGTPTREE